jgi:hypothetical protein
MAALDQVTRISAIETEVVPAAVILLLLREFARR